MKLPEQVTLVMDILKKNNFEAFIVGGAVRDFLLGKEPNDYDIATNALPAQMKSIFTDFKVIDTGLKHGTITVFANHHPMEITTYRTESDYLDYRRPSKVKFVDQLYLDLSRRDFTMNALAFDTKIVDYFSGKNDIDNKIIRCVGNANTRFSEDALRILRAMRFATQLEFTIAPDTEKAIFNQAHLLKNIASERITYEFSHMIMHAFWFVWPKYFDVFKVFIPELLQEKAGQVLEPMQKSEHTLPLRLAILMQTTSDATSALNRLNYPNIIQKQVKTILTYANITVIPHKIAIKKLLQTLSIADLMYIVSLQNAFGKTIDIFSLIEEIQGECYQIKDLAINGYDLMALGIKKKQIALLLKEVLMQVIEENIDNEKESIIDYVKKVLINTLDKGNEKDAT